MSLLILLTPVYISNSQMMHSYCESVHLLSYLCSSIHRVPSDLYCFDIDSGTQYMAHSDTENCKIKTKIDRN